MLESNADKSFSQSTLQQTSQKRLTSNDAAIMQREREITDIAKGIIELADIFKELQSMVIDQGTMLDRIDYNVERMNTDVKAAEKELVVVCPLCLRKAILSSSLTRRWIGHWISAEDYQTQDSSITSSSSRWYVYPSSCETKTPQGRSAANITTWLCSGDPDFGKVKLSSARKS